MSHLEMFQLTYNYWIPILQESLPKHLYYHSVDHTLQVLESAEIIGVSEGLNSDEINLLKIATTLHDTGFLKSAAEHERIGCEMATDFLKSIQMIAEDIERVCSMIMATKIPQSPNNKLDRIICDADLSYFGTDNYDTISNLLFMELGAMGKEMDQKSWIDLQIGFLEKHAFFTEFAKKNFDEVKSKHFNRLKNLRKALK